jgi:hypothetical protein
MRTAAFLTLSMLAGVSILGTRAYAGPADTPLPTFSDGKPAVAVYTVAGVIKNNNLEADFVCTNMDTVARNIGVEVFDETGALRNAIAVGGNGEFLNVVPGGTVTVGTGGTAVFHEDKTITLNGAGSGVNNLRNGSGRVVATSKKVSCTAVVLDKFHVIDPAMLSAPAPVIANLPLTLVP